MEAVFTLVKAPVILLFELTTERSWDRAAENPMARMIVGRKREKE